MPKFTEIPPALIEDALKCAQGDYQRDIITGYESITGNASEKRNPAYFNKHHRQSRKKLIKRLNEAGFKVSYRIDGKTQQKILIIGK